MFLDFSSFLYAPSIFRYDFPSGTLSQWHGAELDFDPADYETTQVFYPSKDGTRIPMFLTHKKGLSLDGNNPVLLYGYGGFNISLTPAFTIGPTVWLDKAARYQLAHLRGSGEK